MLFRSLLDEKPLGRCCVVFPSCRTQKVPLQAAGIWSADPPGAVRERGKTGLYRIPQNARAYLRSIFETFRANEVDPYRGILSPRIEQPYLVLVRLAQPSDLHEIQISFPVAYPAKAVDHSFLIFRKVFHIKRSYSEHFSRTFYSDRKSVV